MNIFDFRRSGRQARFLPRPLSDPWQKISRVQMLTHHHFRPVFLRFLECFNAPPTPPPDVPILHCPAATAPTLGLLTSVIPWSLVTGHWSFLHHHFSPVFL